MSLSLVYLAFAAHIIHWKLTGRTLAPLELNEVMYTLELGIVTAGFLFMCFLVLGTLIFGRFFCSWACHIMVLQELCAWLLSKIGIRAKAFRSRLLLFVPPLTAFYMFLWPQLVRAWHERAIPTFHYATDREGWASFVTNNFWRNLPGPWIIALTFLVCGFLVVYVLGTRTFCTYVCPYGAIFGLADRFAVGRIRVDHDLCKQCGQCTKACTSSVRVHCETAQFGTVVNPGCLKCLDCVSVCPQQALSYGFSSPALFKSERAGGRFGLPYDFSLPEDLLAASVFMVALLTFRGLYGRIPLLLSLAIGLIVGYLAVLTVRSWRRADASLSTLLLTKGRRFTPIGWAFQGFMIFLTAFVSHSAFVRYHEFSGLCDAIALVETREDASVRDALASSAQGHLLTADRWSLLANERVERGVVSAAAQLREIDLATQYADRYLTRHPNDAQIRLTIAGALVEDNRAAEGEKHLRLIVANTDPSFAQNRPLVVSARVMLGNLFVRRADYVGAAQEFQAALELNPTIARVRADLGSALAELGQFDSAIEQLRQAADAEPTLARVNYNLGTLLSQSGRTSESVACFEKELRIAPNDDDAQNNLGTALLRLGRTDEALTHFQRAIELNANQANAHFNVGRVLWERGDHDAALVHFQKSAALDPRYQQLLSSE